MTGRDAPVVAELRKAGAVILGKTNLSEWANIRSNQFDERVERDRRAGAQPYALDRSVLRIVERIGRGGGGELRAGGDRAPRPTGRWSARPR